MKVTKPNRKRTAVIYTRVSTDEQKENGFSLQDQLSKLQSDCKKNDVEILNHYQDDHSAKDFNRPEFNKFLKDVETKKIKPDMFICVRPDRFSRNLTNTMTMLTKFKSLGIEFRTLENHTNLDSPESLLPFMIYNLMPQIDNERRGLNTKQGMRQAKLEGRTMGRPPLGYLNEKFSKTVVFDPLNALLIKQGFEELAKGIYPIEEVRRQLIKLGMKKCCSQSFLNHVRNPYYCGVIKIPAYKEEPEFEVIGQHPPLISKELFYKVQGVLFGNRKKSTIVSTRKNELPLRGHLICNDCGGKLTGSQSTSRNGSKHFYYHCQKGCRVRFRADLANITFEQYLGALIIKKDVLKLYKKILEDVFNEDEKDRQKLIISAEEKIKQIELKLISLEDKFLNNAINPENYHTMNTRIQKELEDLKIKIEDLSIDNSDFKKYFEFGLLFLYNAEEYYKNADLEIKQKIIGSILPEKIVFHENKYRTVSENKLLTLLTLNINEFGGFKIEKAIPKNGLSSKAPSLGLEPRTL